MSIPGPALALTALEAGALGLLQELHGRTPRGLQWQPVDEATGEPIPGINGAPIIDTLIAQVTVEEQHEDTLYITEHPVAQGAAISDHAFKLPARLRLTLGWSNSPSPLNAGILYIPANIISGLAATASLFSGTPSYVRDIYSRLLLVQESRVPVTIYTGKRTYVNMLLRNIRTTTDKDTENALIAVVDAQQIIIVNTRTVILPSKSTQLDPETTAPVVDNGAIQAKAVPDLATDQMGQVDPGWDDPGVTRIDLNP